MEIEELERRAKITSEQCAGIQPMHLAFYGQSIHYSAERCLSAFARYDELLKSESNAIELVSTVQDAIGHAAALSRYFWPTSMGSKKKEADQIAMRLKRGEKLRQHFNVDETSAIYNRDLRNAWEHFDEKLDTYLLSNDAGYFFPSPMSGSHETADDPVGKIFKLIDPEENCLVLLGKKFFFMPIRTEVQRILSK
jgi:hypothetical protein